MSLFGGIVKSLVNPMTLAQLAMGPAGWASILAKAVVSAVAQQVIQQVGQKLGLPDGVINLAQQAFSAAAGGGNALNGGGSAALGGLANNFGRATSVADVVREFGPKAGLNLIEQAKIERQADDMVDNLVQQLTRQNSDEAKKLSKKAEDKKSGGDGSKGFLMAIAEALGEAADKKMNQMWDLSQQIKDQTDQNTKFVDSLGSKPSQKEALQANNNQTKLGTLNSQFQAVTQELSILQNVISTSLKAIGEAQSTVARKN